MAAVEADSLSIPLIDFSQYTEGTPTTRHDTAHAILNGFRSAGFIYLSNHGIAPSSIAATFAHSTSFFSRPQSQKDALEWTGPTTNTGYTCMGREKVTDLLDKSDVETLRAQIPDLKESFEIGRSGIHTPWPVDTDGSAEAFRTHMRAFHTDCAQLHAEVMRALALALDLPESWFDSFTAGADNTLRLLHYPEVRKSVFRANAGQVRAGAHTDYGSLTLLFQDKRGGLQVQSPHGTFIDATPREGTIVVNAGDLLARWSNDLIKSTVHRVVEPPAPEEGEVHPARYSVAYFCNPNFEKWIDAIPGTIRAGEERKYEGVNSGEYLAQRLATTY